MDPDRHQNGKSDPDPVRHRHGADPQNCIVYIFSPLYFCECQDELKIASSEEDKKYVVELFERGVQVIPTRYSLFYVSNFGIWYSISHVHVCHSESFFILSLCPSLLSRMPDLK
jgi:hypothetical protein